MQITIILKQKFESLPPVINIVDFFIEQNINVNLICTDIESDNLNNYSNNIKIFIVKLPNFRFRWLKFFSIIFFRQKVYSIFKANNIGIAKNSYIWIGSAEAAVGLGHKISKYKYIFHCHELYDRVIQYKILNRFYFKNSIMNVCPEKNRATIYRYWYNLNQTPTILVNSPFNHPKIRRTDIVDDFASRLIKNLSNKKIILYMGVISSERDLIPFARAVEKLGDEYHLLLLGRTLEKNGYLEGLLDNYKNVSHIHEIPAPGHFQVASWAYIGILSYSFSSLNNVFCAPNKIWEYSGFGIPMISNDVPGIENLLTKYNSGISLNQEIVDSAEIIEAISYIDRNYIEFSNNASDMFRDCDFRKQLNSILLQLNGMI